MQKLFGSPEGMHLSKPLGNSPSEAMLHAVVLALEKEFCQKIKAIERCLDVKNHTFLNKRISYK